jgi:hypothetical protein
LALFLTAYLEGIADELVYDGVIIEHDAVVFQLDWFKEVDALLPTPRMREVMLH